MGNISLTVLRGLFWKGNSARNSLWEWMQVGYRFWYKLDLQMLAT